MCLYFSNAFFGRTIFFIRGTFIFYICGWDYIRRGFFLGGLQYVNHNVIILPRLKKNLFFPFRINIVELNHIYFLLHGSEFKKTRMSGEDNDTRYSVFSRI